MSILYMLLELCLSVALSGGSSGHALQPMSLCPATAAGGGGGGPAPGLCSGHCGRVSGEMKLPLTHCQAVAVRGSYQRVP